MMSKIFRTTASRAPTDVASDLFHAHYTANVLEDEIRKIRKEDHPYRKAYNDLKNPSEN